MELNFEMQLPRWNQGDEHWVITALKQWFSLPAWTVEQAASLLVSINPKSKTDGELTLINGASISLHTDNLQEKELLVSIPRIRDDILEAAAAHGIERLSPEEWITFAESIGVSPSWKQLALHKGLLTKSAADKEGAGKPIEAQANKSAPAAKTLDWMVEVRQLADRIALRQYSSGIREFSARSMSRTLEMELGKPVHAHLMGARGCRSAEDIRTRALKGWRFTPPKGGSNGSNGSSE